jgi:pyruvate kinase
VAYSFTNLKGQASMAVQITDRIMERLLPRLIELRERALKLEHGYAEELGMVEPSYRPSARNFLHYMAVRKHDIRELQRDLASVGLSSLGVLEPHVLASLNAVIGILERLTGRQEISCPEPPVDFRTGPLLLRDQTASLLGPPSQNRSVRIMVTMPSEAAEDEELLTELLDAGMDVMRINCAHDDADAWENMVSNLRKAERKVGRICKVQADLAGPKLRTGTINPIGRVMKVKPKRDPLGGVVFPGQVWLTPADRPDPPPGRIRVIPLDQEFVAASRRGDRLVFRDARGKRRCLTVAVEQGSSRLAETDQTVYVDEGREVLLYRGETAVLSGRVGSLADVVVPLHLYPRDTLILARSDGPGREAVRSEDGKVKEAARIHCTFEAAFDQVRPGERVWFDDGRIGGIVRENNGAEINVEITRTGPSGARLGGEKGINFPDTVFSVPALTQKDIRDLERIVGFVDMIALSFLRGPADVALLEDHLHRLGAGHLGIVLKIENRQAFENLPRILITSLSSPPVGVMVARGDLAVEMGFERLSEVQEEILWLCEAAHIPVIWATQILESMAKKGSPSRAEVTDAAMSSRAECAMLNKGPNIVETVAFLSGVLSRMEPHHYKRRALLRKLSIAANL